MARVGASGVCSSGFCPVFFTHTWRVVCVYVCVRACVCVCARARVCVMSLCCI